MSQSDAKAPRLKEGSLPWIWPRSLRHFIGLSIRSLTPPEDARGPPDLFVKLLPPPAAARAWLQLEVRGGAVAARVGAQTERSRTPLPVPLYESEVLTHSLNPTWMLSESSLPAAARTLRSVVVSVHRAHPTGTYCLWERLVCFDSLVHVVTELSPPARLPPDTLLLHFEDGTCLSRDALAPLDAAGLLAPTSVFVGRAADDVAAAAPPPPTTPASTPTGGAALNDLLDLAPTSAAASGGAEGGAEAAAAAGCAECSVGRLVESAVRLSEDGAPPASVDYLKARAAPTRAAPPPEQLRRSSPWPEQLASARPEDEFVWFLTLDYQVERLAAFVQEAARRRAALAAVGADNDAVRAALGARLDARGRAVYWKRRRAAAAEARRGLQADLSAAQAALERAQAEARRRFDAPPS